MKARSDVRPLSGIVTVWPEHQRPSSATHTESERPYTSTRSARSAAASTTTCAQTARAQHATKGRSQSPSAGSGTRYTRKSAPINRLGRSGRPSASTRRNVRRTPGFVANTAYPPSGASVLEILSRMSLKCQTPGQMAESRADRRMLPRSREEFAACAKLAVAGAAACLGVPAVMSLMHLGGVF